jgi:hypothetical protein
MAKTLKRMKSLTWRRNKYLRIAVLLAVFGWAAIFSGREVGIALAALGFMAASAYFQRGKIWGAGALGERKVHEVLQEIPGEIYIVNDLLIPKETGTAQIDHVLISEFGIFCIETKHYSGTLAGGDEYCMHYTQNGSRRVYPPAKQAAEHARALTSLLRQRPEYWEAREKGLSVQPLVVFSGSLRLRYKSSEVPLMKLKDLPKYMEKMSERRILPPRDVATLALFILGSDLEGALLPGDFGQTASDRSMEYPERDLLQ